MQLERMMAYVESVLIISLCNVQMNRPVLAKKRPTSSVALQRDMGMAGNSPAGSCSPPGVSIQRHQQGQNPQRWPLDSLYVVHLLGLSPARQNFETLTVS